EVLDLLAQDTDLYRLYIKDEIVPAPSVQRASLYPNTSLTYGIPSANLYLPLTPARYQAALRDVTPQILNHWNVRYYLIPQLLPVDAASELYDVLNPFSALPYDTWLPLPSLALEEVVAESYLSHAADLPNGTLA